MYLQKNDMSIKMKVMILGQISKVVDTTLKQNLLSTLGNYEFNGRTFFICKVHRKSENCQEHNVLEIAQRLIDMSELMENDKYEVTTVWKIFVLISEKNYLQKRALCSLFSLCSYVPMLNCFTL